MACASACGTTSTAAAREARAGPHPCVRRAGRHRGASSHRARLVPARGLLRSERPLLPGLERRRDRRSRGPHVAPRLPEGPRHRCALADADLPDRLQGLRLRHRGLPHDRSGLRRRGRVRRARCRGARAEDARVHGPRPEPHVRQARVVPGVALEQDQPEGRLVPVVRHAEPRRPRHVRPRQSALRHRLVEGRDARTVLLPSLLRRAARPELPEPRGREGDARRGALLARSRDGRLPLRRHRQAVRVARRLRHAPRDRRVHQEAARGPEREERSRHGRRAVPARRLDAVLRRRLEHVPHDVRLRLRLLLAARLRRPRQDHRRQCDQDEPEVPEGRPAGAGHRLARRAARVAVHGGRALAGAQCRAPLDDAPRNALRLQRRRARHATGHADRRRRSATRSARR